MCCFVFCFTSFVLLLLLFCFYFSIWWYFCFLLEWNRWNQFYRYNTKKHGEILNCNGLKLIGLFIFQWDLKSETCVRISDSHFHWGVPLFLLTRDAAFLFSIQCNLLEGCCERILTQQSTQVMDYPLPWSNTTPSVVVCDKCYISNCF